MKSIITFTILMFSACWGFTQNVNFEHVAAFGNKTEDEGRSLIQDKSGNTYSTRFFTGRVDFDHGKDTFYLSSFGKKDVFVVKQDSKGEFVWAVQMGGSLDDQANGIGIDSSHNLYITGYFQGNADFDPDTSSNILTSNGRSDIFICKLDANGMHIWANNFGGQSDDAGNSISVNVTGTVYVTGYFMDTISITTGSFKAKLISNGDKDVFVLRANQKGEYDWLVQMGGSTEDIGNGITMDKSEYPHITGSFTGKADFDPGTKVLTLGAAGDADVFVVQLDPKGNLVWAGTFSGRNYESGHAIVLDGSGLVYVTGPFNGTTDFDPHIKGTANLTSAGKSDVFITVLKSNGDYAMAQKIGGREDDISYSIEVDASSNIYTCGFFGDAVDFDPGTSTYTLTSAGDGDIFISKLSSSGSFVWAKNMGGSDFDCGFDICLNTSQKVFSTGCFNDRADFDPTKGTYYVTSNGDKDVFVLTMDVCKATSSTIIASNCFNYTFNGVTYDVSGNYTTVLTNANGCDSNVTLKLTINTTTFKYIDTVACKSFTLNGITYTSSGTYNQLLTNKNGCDSILVLIITFGETAYSFNAIACNEYNLNGIKYTSSGTYKQTIKNRSGCDSTITIKLTIKKASNGVANVKACESYTTLGTTFTISGTYFLLTKNSQDCDSNLTLNLTINKKTSRLLQESVCESYALNGKIYDKTGIYTQVIPNKKGCDSTITLDLSVNKSSSQLTETGCKSYRLNSQVYTTSGIYQQTIPNYKGCDSAITLNLTINNVNAQVVQNGSILSAKAENAVYQWLDCEQNYAIIPREIMQNYFAKRNGIFAVKVTENSCTDTSICMTVNFNNVKENSLTGIKLYPNPFKDNLLLTSVSLIENGNVNVIGMDGRVIFKQKDLKGNSFQLDLQGIAKGIYVLEFSENNQIYRSKLIKD